MDNNLIKKYFDELSKNRKPLADALDNPALSGVKNSVVEKYSDQAHFIYELLQNADDAKATSVHFTLHTDKLIFAHNGTKRFSISNPATEAADSENGALGDINAITSIGNSNKTSASIGKFGVGFKSVFQYTSKPCIYDPDIFFQIDRFIVPIPIVEDFPERKPDETLFIFPFDNSLKSKEDACKDISAKLQSLKYPLLFLSCIENISFVIPDGTGSYGKKILNKQQFGNTIIEYISLRKKCDDKTFNDKLCLFSRTSAKNHRYSAGFFINQNNQLVENNSTAFCFFPTKEVTNLNFIIHAPFLLTDSRESIKARDNHNTDMINLLAALAADSLLYLRDIGKNNNTKLINDNIFNIIPYNKNMFGGDDKSTISFKPFYESILSKMSTAELLPTDTGFTSKDNAYWASVPKITTLFTNKQLAKLSGNEKAKWVFASFGKNDVERYNKALTEYIIKITHKSLDQKDIINGWRIPDNISGFYTHVIAGINSEFIEAQEISWLHSFYQWIGESKERTGLIKTKPIFLNQDKRAVPAADSNGHIILFLPTDIPGYNTVLPELLENQDTADFIAHLGIKAPSLHDEIYNHILPLYKNNNGKINSTQHFLKIFKYYKECSQANIGDFIALIKDLAFVHYSSANNTTVHRGIARSIYFPNNTLKKWFQAKSDTRFLEYENYLQLVGEYNIKYLNKFFIDIGIQYKPMILPRMLTPYEAYQITYFWNHSSRERSWIENYTDGINEIIHHLIQKQDFSLSLMVWEHLLTSIENNHFNKTMDGEYHYFYYIDKMKTFPSSEITTLRTKPWILSNNNKFLSVNALTVQTLSPQYDTSSWQAKKLIEYLGITNNQAIASSDNLSATEQEKLRQLAELEKIMSFEQITALVVEEAQRNRHANGYGNNDNTNLSTLINPNNPSVARVTKELAARLASTPKPEKPPASEKNLLIIDDEDDYSRATIDYGKKIEQAKERSEQEIREIAQLEDLQQKAVNSTRYSYAWFKTLLELESKFAGENNNHNRKICIKFSRVEREEGTSRTLILKHPNRSIPQFMEELADIPLELHFDEQAPLKVAIEVANVKSYTLRAKLKTNAQLDNVDLSLVTEAIIDAKSPVFLVEELQKAFNELKLNEDYNMQTNLCENIEFIFGPPGTGKTTYLVENVILPIMQKDEVNILVLTPTNKASDVIVRFIMEKAKQISPDWLVRFGTTSNNTIEQSGVFRDKTYDIRNQKKSVIVTTIARFAYDYFLPDEHTRIYLRDFKWDYIIIDEASMIPLINIIFSLYKIKPKKFIIAGDPFQIEPIVTNDIWKNENIYTMVNLNSFSNPTTTPHQYKVVTLTTQYRSIPEIGEIFNQLTYDGVLTHNRCHTSQRKLAIDDFIDVKTLNIIKFPIKKYESIYRPKYLNRTSSYQVYSALFAFEFLKYLAELLTLANEHEFFRIGLIAPYKAQSDLIDKLISAIILPKNIDIQVDTIHGFQGDECDIIIALFNPPPYISSSEKIFLNKLNIINVSISRAKDYLFILMPDNHTENVDSLTLIKKIEKLCKEQTSCIEYHSSTIEEVIFQDNLYLENNAFSTSHHLVNVYRKPEKRYEIRSEDNAIDIQINE